MMKRKHISPDFIMEIGGLITIEYSENRKSCLEARYVVDYFYNWKIISDI